MHPVTPPLRSGLLAVSELHRIYWEESGNPDGLPVIFLHGGPGAGASAACRGFFDPARYRIVIIDQRGCGRSEPLAETRENDTWALVSDLERVREMLGIDRWLVFGGSWGSTLALCYAQTHPERVTGLILRGIFLGRQSEVDWLSEAGGASWIHPEQWQRYLAPIPPDEQRKLVRAYHRRLNSRDDATVLAAAKAWAEWENWLIRFEPQEESLEGHEALAIARLENHYFINHCWLEGERALLANVDRIRHVPIIIVQGRYDICTPMQSAWELKQALPHAELRIVQGGHSAFEPPISTALVQATDEWAARHAAVQGYSEQALAAVASSDRGHQVVGICRQ